LLIVVRAQVCTREEKQLIMSGSREGKKLEEQLAMRQVNDGDTQKLSDTVDQVSLNDIAQAVAFKNRLIEFDRTRFVDVM
jgi:hypothetical protein